MELKKRIFIKLEGSQVQLIALIAEKEGFSLEDYLFVFIRNYFESMR